MDDVCVVCLPYRSRTIFNLGARLSRVAGIRLHDGNTRVWNKAGECPERAEELGPNVWNPDLGHTSGFRRFRGKVGDRSNGRTKIVGNRRLGWQVLLQCAGPRCHHFLRTVPPSPDSHLTQRVTHDASHGEVVGRFHSAAINKPVHVKSFLCDAVGWFGRQLTTLGFLGRCPPQRLPQLAEQFVTAFW